MQSLREITVPSQEEIGGEDHGTNRKAKWLRAAKRHEREEPHREECHSEHHVDVLSCCSQRELRTNDRSIQSTGKKTTTFSLTKLHVLVQRPLLYMSQQQQQSVNVYSFVLLSSPPHECDNNNVTIKKVATSNFIDLKNSVTRQQG